ncbi:hypothetical protein C8R43DRAFT_1237049 [Mycena crocata]|nr:hypothetical protein C8R43DRAFT_1237049 [Mycena crocata]
MSQTFAQYGHTSARLQGRGVQHQPTPVPTREGDYVPFPASWLTPSDAVILPGAEWGKHTTQRFSADWKRYGFVDYLRCDPVYPGYLIPRISIELRLYFDIQGCIVPIAWDRNPEHKAMAFTIAGPCDSQGQKPVYLLYLNPTQSQDTVKAFPMNFSSISDFHTRARAFLMSPGLNMVERSVDVKRISGFRAIDGRFWPSQERNGKYPEVHDTTWNTEQTLKRFYPLGH